MIFVSRNSVQVLLGEIFDVVVDVRRASPSFGRWESFALSERGGEQLYVPRGFAHGFYVLSERAIVAYKQTAPYDPSAEGEVRWNDPDVGIVWPLDRRAAALPRRIETLPASPRSRSVAAKMTVVGARGFIGSAVAASAPPPGGTFERSRIRTSLKGRRSGTSSIVPASPSGPTVRRWKPTTGTRSRSHVWFERAPTNGWSTSRRRASTTAPAGLRSRTRRACAATNPATSTRSANWRERASLSRPRPRTASCACRTSTVRACAPNCF